MRLCMLKVTVLSQAKRQYLVVRLNKNDLEDHRLVTFISVKDFSSFEAQLANIAMRYDTDSGKGTQKELLILDIKL